MNYITAFSTKQEIPDVISELQEAFIQEDIGMILYFASPTYNPENISAAMQNAFKDTEVFGCTTAGEIVSGKMLDNSIVAMAFNKNIVGDIKIELLENVKEDEQAVDKAFASLGTFYGTTMAKLDHNKYVGILLTDGLSGREEKIIERIGDLTNITFTGGSIGDNLKFEKTYAYVNGKAYQNAAIIAIFKPNTEFNIIKTQSLNITDKKLKITKTNEANREVIEFNGKPATEAYAEALNIAEEKISEYFLKHPLGLIGPDNKPFVRSPRVIENKSILFYCSIVEGMELSVLNSYDIIEETKNAILEKQKEMGGISAIINFHCILRTLELKKNNQTKDYGKIFTNIPTIGFSTYGECYLGHINQTSTMLVFK